MMELVVGEEKIAWVWESLFLFSFFLEFGYWVLFFIVVRLSFV